jgi:hypothetical protein
MEQVEVWQGRHGDPVPLLGPLPGVRQDDTLAYEFGIPSRLVPWPGRSRLMRVFVLLDLGVALSIPAWRSRHGPDQDKSEPERPFGERLTWPSPSAAQSRRRRPAAAR